MARPSGIEDQIGWLRTLRGLTQEELAELADMSVDVVRRLEQGVRSTARLTTLMSLAQALGVTLADLLSDPGADGRKDARVTADLQNIRRVLTSPHALTGFADFCDDSSGIPDLAALHASTEKVWGLYQDGSYLTVSALLPDLITEARHAVRETSGDDQIAAHAVLATAFQASAGIAITLGKEDLAFIAVERAVTAAEQCGDPLHQASAANFLSWIYRRHGRLAEAEEVATRAAERYEPRWLTSAPEQVSVFGGLLLNASGAAARANRAQRSQDLAVTARAAATHAAEDRVDRWAVFGPSIVAMTEVNNAVEYNDPDEALELTARVPVQGRVPATWTARYLLNVAHLQCEHRQGSAATATLQEVQRLAPEWIRYHPQAEETVQRLLRRVRRPSPALAALATHLRGAGSNGPGMP